MKDPEFAFWNDPEMVAYFAAKPADPIIVERLNELDVSSGNLRALDLGCGGGRHSELLASRGFDVTSVDINPAMLEATKERLNKSGYCTTTKTMSVDRLDFEDEIFDVVVSTGVLHQVRSLGRYAVALQGIARVLKPGGLFTMNIFTNTCWDETYTVPEPSEPYTVLTTEKLFMTLLSKPLFYALASDAGLELEQEVREDIKQENTGPRSILRAHLLKS